VIHEALILLAVAYVLITGWKIYDLRAALRQYQQAERDDMNRLDEWATTLEREHKTA